MKEHQKEFGAIPIVTEIAPLKTSTPPRTTTVTFANKNPNQGYVCAVVKPKVEKFSKRS